MNTSMTLAEMANNTNYAEMNYSQLLELNVAFSWALCNVKSLMPVKRQEEMKAITLAYTTAMSGYGATKTEMHTCIEDSSEPETPVVSMPSKDIDDQTSISATLVTEEDSTVKTDMTLALPEADTINSEEDNEATVSDNPCIDMENDSSASKIVETAIKHALSRPADEWHVDIDKPYFTSCSYGISEDGELSRHLTVSKNLSSEDLQAFKPVVEKFAKLVLKGREFVSSEDYLAYMSENGDIVTVWIYRTPEGECDKMAEEIQEDTTNTNVTYDDIKKHKKMISVMKKAIKSAKEMMALANIKTPCFGKYEAHTHTGSTVSNINCHGYVYGTPSELKEIIEVTEAYAKYYYKNVEIVAMTDCFAVKVEGRGDIWVGVVNDPDKSVENDKSKLPTPKKENKKTVGRNENKSGESIDKKTVEKKEAKAGIKKTINRSKGKSMKNAPIKTKKKDPRCVAVIGTKDGVTMEWESFKACEEALEIGHGMVSQYISGKIKTPIKGWDLKKKVSEAM